jgi:tetratricopeptide (TPR) repeat protein
MADGTIAFNMGNVYLATQEFELALENYQEAIDVNCQNAKYWLHKGIVYEAMINDIEQKHGPQLKKLKTAERSSETSQ